MVKLTKYILTVAVALTAPDARSVTPEFLDQSYVLDQSVAHSYVIVSSGRFAQTFRVGTSGFLSRVDLQIESWTGYPPNPDLLTSPLLFSLNTVLPSGMPGSTILASATIPGYQVPYYAPPNLVSIDLSAANLLVTAGQSLTLVLSTALPAPLPDQPLIASYGWFFKPDENGYAGGATWTKFQNNQWVQRNHDLGFQTFITPVPEPSSFALLGLGAALVLRRRRR